MSGCYLGFWRSSHAQKKEECTCCGIKCCCVAAQHSASHRQFHGAFRCRLAETVGRFVCACFLAHNIPQRTPVRLLVQDADGACMSACKESGVEVGSISATICFSSFILQQRTAAVSFTLQQQVGAEAVSACQHQGASNSRQKNTTKRRPTQTNKTTVLIVHSPLHLMQCSSLGHC